MHCICRSLGMSFYVQPDSLLESFVTWDFKIEAKKIIFWPLPSISGLYR